MRRRALAGMLAAALGLALGGCSGGASRGQAGPAAGAEERATVRVAVMPFLSYAPIFLGVDGGQFAAHGLDVELVPLRTTEANAALVRGDVDVAANFLSAGLFNLIGRGNRVAIVADKGWLDPASCEANGIVARTELAASSELEAAAGLRGRSVHYRPGTIEEYVLDRVLAAAGLGLGDLDAREVPAAAKVEALASGALDLAAWSEPYLTVAEEAGAAVLWRGAAEASPGGQWAMLLFGRSLLDERPEVGERFIAAYLEAVELYAEGKSAANVAVLARHTGLEPGLVERACWMPLRADGRIDTPSVLAFQRWAVERGYLDAVEPVERFWEPRFVDAAAARERP